MSNMNDINYQSLLSKDRDFIWHPYSGFGQTQPLYPVRSAKGYCLTLADGRELIDAMASWWCVIHGYGHPYIDAALKKQIDTMSHVMFGGLTHEPAVSLAEKLINITPDVLQAVFFSDSGSVSVEVAMKMAVQYWQARAMPEKHRFLTPRGGYHGDTLAAMSVCDPVNGMHRLFKGNLPEQLFVERPEPAFSEPFEAVHITELEQAFTEHHDAIAACILEPIVQGAGGMRFYSPQYLHEVRRLCDEFNVLLILDEIATGFGRSGKLFACEHADISPDIMCVGKALTGGYLSLAATLTSTEIAETISASDPGVFMHGPTFMANPLACTAANASLELLDSMDWQSQVKAIESSLANELSVCRDYETVADVRVLGAIGVVETKRPVDMATITSRFIEAGVWVRPFGKLVYTMPGYGIAEAELQQITGAFRQILSDADILLD